MWHQQFVHCVLRKPILIRFSLKPVSVKLSSLHCNNAIRSRTQTYTGLVWITDLSSQIQWFDEHDCRQADPGQKSCRITKKHVQIHWDEKLYMLEHECDVHGTNMHSLNLLLDRAINKSFTSLAQHLELMRNLFEYFGFLEVLLNSCDLKRLLHVYGLCGASFKLIAAVPTACSCYLSEPITLA